MAYNTGFGSANEVLGGSRFVELGPVPCGKAFHEVDTTPLLMPDRLYNPVRNWFDNPPVTRDLSIVPKPEPLFKPFVPELHLDPDPQYTLTGVIRSKPVHTWERKDPELAMPFIDTFAIFGKKGRLR